MRAERPRFVDSNVLVYAHDRTAKQRHVAARDVVAELWESRLGALSVQVLQELFVNVSRRAGTPQARRLVSDYAAWPTHAPDAADVLEAIDIHREYKISFWDAMIVRSASRLGCGVLLTEDLNARQSYRGVRVESPFQ